MKIVRIIMFLVVISILVSIFMLTSCENKTGGRLRIVDSDTDTDELNMENDQKVVKIIMFEDEWYPSYIELEKGDVVLFRIRNAGTSDTNFRLKGFGINEEVPEGREVKIEFVSDMKGRFQITEGLEGFEQVRGVVISE